MKAAVNQYFSGTDTVAPLKPTAQTATAREISHRTLILGITARLSIQL